MTGFSASNDTASRPQPRRKPLLWEVAEADLSGISVAMRMDDLPTFKPTEQGDKNCLYRWSAVQSKAHSFVLGPFPYCLNIPAFRTLTSHGESQCLVSEQRPFPFGT
jgi:hypothetical protein